jgi:glycine cleavage system H protein
MHDRRYARTDEWLQIDGAHALVGISDHAQDSLSDIVYVELPSVGDKFDAGQPFGVVESVKAASDLLMPVAGEVTEVNDAAVDKPESLNGDPYGSWLVKILISDVGQLQDLMDADAYTQYLDTREH